MTTEPLGVLDQQRLLDQTLTIWVNPEVERRIQTGKAAPGFRLLAFQIVFPSPHDRRSHEVRLNGEVRVLVRYKTDGAVEVGDMVSMTADRVGSFRLPDDEDPNAAHLTAVQFGQQWVVGFDFTYNRDRAEQRLKAAREFLTAAEGAAANGLFRPAYECLFGALELAAEADLILVPTKPTKKHQERAKRFKEWVKLGNAPSGADVGLYRLAQRRADARYLGRPFAATKDDFDNEASIVRSQIEHARARLRRVDEDDAPQATKE